MPLVSAAEVAQHHKIFSEIVANEDLVAWLQHLPEQGRTQIVVQFRGGLIQKLSYPYSVKSKVYEYGGGALVAAQRNVYFVNEADQQIYAWNGEREVRPLTSCSEYRFGDLHYHARADLLLAIAETVNPDQPPQAFLVCVEQGTVHILHQGRDFYACPRLSADAAELCFLAWDHPFMPWDAAELWCAALDPQFQLTQQRKIAGGAREAICQPEFSEDEKLLFVSDRSAWWNLYHLGVEGVECLYATDQEFGAPMWGLGTKTFAVVDDSKIACRVVSAGRDQLAILDLIEQKLKPICSELSAIQSLVCTGERLYFVGGGFTSQVAVYQYDLSCASLTNLSATQADKIDSKLPRLGPELMTFVGAQAHCFGWFYAAHTEAGRLPPLIVKCHGGPTGCAEKALDLRIQYWVTHGFAVLDLNYRGSSGFGRKFRHALYGQWGVADVQDVELAVRSLIQAQRVHEHWCFISGSSAGGYTVLASLANSEIFAGGASYYGISDLSRLAQETHKFESHYLDWLVGEWPQAQTIYAQRSPLFHAQDFSAPVIFFQGANDLVVPSNQARRLSQKLNQIGIKTQYLEFEHEGHGFRHGKNIEHSLEAERQFYVEIMTKN